MLILAAPSFFEQHLMQHGQQKHFRWEIPYQYIVRLEEVTDPPASAKSDTPVPKTSSGAKSAQSPKGEGLRSSSSAAGSTSGDTPGILPLGHPPKTT